jgi:importin subunit beta-1
MDLQTVLLAAASPDTVTRQQAEALLQQATESQYGPFLQALCMEFVSEDKPEANRQMAGLYMKNLIVANDSTIKANKLAKWNACAEKETIKTLFLQGLHSVSSVVRDTAAQILAAFGAVEIEDSKWNELIPSLLQNVNDANVSHGAKVATLKALGYLCDELFIDLPAAMVNQILMAIITGITADKPNDMRFAAVKALKDSLIFASNNFKVDHERNHIMTSIYDAALSPDANIRETAYQCLVKVVENYYDLIGPYMPQLIQLTLNCVQTDSEENVQKQAIEFWSVICEREDVEEGSSAVNLKIMAQCFTAITPALLSTLVKQSDDLDGDDWNVASAGGLCLKLLTKVVGDPIVDTIIGFVASNIQSADWRFREAAILAFGSMLDGPKDRPKMMAYIKQCMQFLLQYFKDQNPVVKSSSLWTVSEICSLYDEVAVWDETVFPSVMTNVLEAANDRQPKNVALAAAIFKNVAEAVGAKEADSNATNILSKWNGILFQKLFEIVDRPDGEKESMRDDAFEAIISLVENSADDASPLIGTILQETQRRLTDATNKILQVQAQTQRDPDSNLLSKLLSSIAMSIRRLPSNFFESETVTDAVMACVLTQFTIVGNGALGDAFIVINEIAEKIGRRFERYIGYFDKFLYSALKYEYGKEACEQAVELIVPAICDALQDKITDYIQEIMQRMLELLSNSQLPRDLKPKVIESFGDVALAIKGNFSFFLQTILLALQKAGEATHQYDVNDEDLAEYFNALRKSIISAYGGIVYGLSDGNNHTDPTLTSQVPTIMQLLMLTMKDGNTSADVVNKSLGLLGDLGAIYGVAMKPMYQNAEIQQLVQMFYSRKDQYHQSEYCYNIVMKVLNMA